MHIRVWSCVLSAWAVGACSAGKRDAVWSSDGRFIYAFSLQSSAGVPGVPAPMFALEVEGELELRPEPSRGDEQRVRAALRDVKVSVGGPSSSVGNGYTADLEKPFAMKFVHGALAGLYIEPNVDPNAVAALRTIASSVQLSQAANPGAAAEIDTSEFDATGRYVVHYSRKASGEVQKRKMSYESVLATMNVPSKKDEVSPRPTFDESLETINVVDGAIVSLDLTESIAFDISGKSKMSYRNKIGLKLKERGTASRDKAGELAGQYLPSDKPYARAPRLSDLDEVRIGDLDLGAVIGRLDEIAKQTSLDKRGLSSVDGAPTGAEPDARIAEERNKLFSALAALYRHQPQNIQDALARVKLGAPSAPWLVSAMGSAGSAEGQAALLEVLSDLSLASSITKIAAVSLMQTPQPTPDTAHGLERLLAVPEWQQYALFGLGTVSRRMREQGNPAEADRLATLLLKRLEHETDVSALVDLLAALSNAAYTPSLPALRKLSGHADPAVRAGTAQAVRLIDTADADALILGVLVDKDSEAVRAQGCETAEDRASPRPLLVGGVLDATRGDASAKVRTMCVRTVALWLKQRPDLRSELITIGQRETNAGVLSVLRDALGERGASTP